MGLDFFELQEVQAPRAVVQWGGLRVSPGLSKTPSSNGAGHVRGKAQRRLAGSRHGLPSGCMWPSQVFCGCVQDRCLDVLGEAQVCSKACSS